MSKKLLGLDSSPLRFREKRWGGQEALPFRHALCRGWLPSPLILAPVESARPGRMQEALPPQSVQRCRALLDRHLHALPCPRRWHGEQAPLPAPPTAHVLGRSP